MTAVKRVRYGVLGIALVASGVYLFVYLYRWEWHRALVAGVLFVAAEVAMASSAILDRLRSIEGRLESGAGAGAGAGGGAAARTGPATAELPETLARIREAAPEPRTNFDWLTKPRSEMSVFVPLLLGTGVVLSAAAWVVERLARVTAGPVLERGLAARLRPLSLPVGTLAGAPAPAVRSFSLVPHVAALVVVVGLATVGLDALADATQNRPDVRRPGTASSIVLSVDSHTRRSPVALTESLWGACTTQIGSHKILRVTELGEGKVHLLVRPAVGKYTERRLRGCLTDATTDKIMARVVSVSPLTGS